MSTFDDDVTTLENAMRLFAQTMKRPQRWAQIVAESGIAIDRPSAVILQTLVLHQPKCLHIQDLAAQLAIEPPSVTRKTQALEQLGYLRRAPDPKDGRAVTLEVTKAGRAVSDKLWRIQRQVMRAALQDWPAADRQQFVKLFKRFSQDLTTGTDIKVMTPQKG
jgi:DNA-binding MarR family transcriptional regulator